MNLPVDVTEILDALLSGMQEALGDALTGLYLRGSLVLGDFDPGTSDVDFLAVVEAPITAAQFSALAAMHEELGATGTAYSDHLEGAYIHRQAVLRLGPGERRHPEIIAEHPLVWAELRDNWVLERWVVRERGVALAGPDAATLIAPIEAPELRAAAHSELVRRAGDWARDGVVPPAWLRARFMQAFEVETVCRALFTMRFGELCSKPRAVAWAREALPPPWRELVEASQPVRADHTEDLSGIDAVKAFARWSAGEGATWAARVS